MSGRRHGVILSVVAIVMLACPATTIGVTHLKRGMLAPVVKLVDLDGETIDTEVPRRRTLVLVFGELYHEKTLAACRDIDAALEDETLAGEPVTPLLIVAQDAPRAALRTRAAEAELEWRILHDVERRTFGHYRVTVMPSVVVIDTEGRVVHAIAGYTGRFADIVTDAMRVSAGTLSAEQFLATLHPASGGEADEDRQRADRLANLARQLARRGLPELAEEKYVEALELAPAHGPARLGLGMLKLRSGRLAEAELEFSAILEGDPKSVDGRLGLAYVQSLRGGNELEEAEALARSVIASNASEPRAHYLLGLIHEERDRMEEAAASFRAAAELLMSRRGTWDPGPIEGAGNR